MSTDKRARLVQFIEEVFINSPRQKPQFSLSQMQLNPNKLHIRVRIQLYNENMQ